MKSEVLDALLDRTATAVGAIAEKRDSANEYARTGIWLVEDRLVAALGGDVLRGLPNLLPERGAKPFLGLRVNGSSGEAGASAPLPKDGREVLVLTKQGRLVVARRVEASGTIVAETREPKSEELIADDAEPFVRLVARALSEHLARTDRRIQSYEATQALSEKLVEAFSPTLTIR